MTLTTLAEQLQGRVTGPDVSFAGLSTDTRTLRQGDAYLALVGERFDGNDFVQQAADAGASAAIVSRQMPPGSLSLLQVGDTHKALGEIARENRRRSHARVIALTGSQGKTTVKEMIASILMECGPTLYTAANLNNTIGVPLTLLRLTAEHQYAVIEMGANAPGEIDFSVRMTEPDVALITNASAAHIEGFGSLQGIVEAKGEILDGLREEGLAVLNADDANVGQWLARAGSARTVLFGLQPGSSEVAYHAEAISLTDKGEGVFTLVTPQGRIAITMQLLGQHNVVNALAAAAVCMELGAELGQVQSGLAKLQPVRGRLCPLPGPNGSLLLDDTYNASPSSFFAAIDVLRAFTGLRILVAGDMKELGQESDDAHASVGRYAKQAGIDALWAVGESSRLTVQAFGEAGRHFPDRESLAEACREKADGNTVFLVKGSRGAGMDAIIKILQTGGDY